MMINILLKDFSKTPFGRDAKDGPDNGERFRKEHLVPAFTETDETVLIDLRGISIGIGSSFLEESIGGLIRKEGIPKEEVKSRLLIEADLSLYKSLIEKFINRAIPQL